MIILSCSFKVPLNVCDKTFYFTNLQFQTIIILFHDFILFIKKSKKKRISVYTMRQLLITRTQSSSIKPQKFCLMPLFCLLLLLPLIFSFINLMLKQLQKCYFLGVYVNAKSLSEQQLASSSVQWLLLCTTTSTFLIEMKNFFYNFFMMTNISNVSHLQLQSNEEA